MVPSIEGIKTTYPNGSTYTISVNTEDLDGAITKMNELVALLNKVNELTSLLLGNLVHVEERKRNVQKQQYREYVKVIDGVMHVRRIYEVSAGSITVVDLRKEQRTE